jgi:hypothetical protein
MLKKILAILAAVGAFFSAIFYVLFQQKKDENKALNEKFEDMANNLDAITEADKAANEVKKENEEIKQKINSGNTLDSFNACNDLLSK